MPVVLLLAALAAPIPPPGLQEGYRALRAKRFDEAVSSFTEAVKDQPAALPQAWGWGMALYGKGDLAGALEVFERVLKADPKHVRALYGRALVKMRTGGDPAPDLEAALQLRPKDVRARFRLGQALADRGAYDEAAEHLRQVLKLRWIHQPARHALILALRDAGKVAEAQAVAAQFRRVDPLVERIQTAEGAVRRRPDDVEARERLKTLYAEAGREF